MSQSQLKDKIVGYVLDEFDANVPLDLILHAIHEAGEIDVTINAIRECLLLYGRITSLNQPIDAARGRTAQSAALTNDFKKNVYNSNGARTQYPLTLHPTVEFPALHGNSQAGQATSTGWDVEADEFTKSAHTQGQTVPQIADSLHKKGYLVSAVQVFTSMTRQGLSNVRW